MKRKYRILINGTNLLMNLSSRERYGFYTTRFVEASSEPEAINKAYKMIKTELKKHVENLYSDPPRMSVDEIDEVESFDHPGKGFSFYPEGNDKKNA